jgi:integrase
LLVVLPAKLLLELLGGRRGQGQKQVLLVTARLVFTDPAGAALHRSGFNAVAWQPALRGAGVPLARENGMHALRHYFANALLSNGVDIRMLATYLGHSDLGFTLRIYTHLMPEAADRMRAAVDAVFAASDGPATAQGVRR